MKVNKNFVCEHRNMLNIILGQNKLAFFPLGIKVSKRQPMPKEKSFQYREKLQKFLKNFSEKIACLTEVYAK